MKTLKINSAILLLSFILITGCGKSDDKTAGNDAGKKEVTEQTQKSTEENTAVIEGEVVEIKLPTMQCSMCKKTIEKEVKKLEGVNDVNVVVKEKVAKVTYDKSKTDVGSIEGVIISAGSQANDKPANKEAYEKLDDCCKIGAHD
ncbi:MAG: cation transporter [Ignavibacteria bacterium]